MLMKVAMLMEQNQVNSPTAKAAGNTHKPSPRRPLSGTGTGQSV